MARSEVITVSMQELDRLKTVQAVVDGQLRPGVAAERLEITDRQLRRLLERYRQEGPSGLVSRKRGRPSNNRLAVDCEAAALGLIREHYADFGPTLACEKLRERHGLMLSKETIRRLMTAAGLWVPRKQRPPKVYQPRNRRACLGELIQIDGCDHRWFEERAPACTLLVYVDDATSRIMELRFTHSESTFTYFAATRAYLERHGKPVAFYSDKASVFRVNKPSATGGNGHTQFARVLFELNIEGICANSSQAKGRVERTHLTLQDRLVKELRLRNISTMEAANAFMAEFITDYNARFAKVPRNSHNAHRPLRSDENLDLIFTVREPRCVSKSLTIQYDKMLYLLDDTPEHRKLAGRYIDVTTTRMARLSRGPMALPCPTRPTIVSRKSTRAQSWTTSASGTCCSWRSTYKRSATIGGPNLCRVLTGRRVDAGVHQARSHSARWIRTTCWKRCSGCSSNRGRLTAPRTSQG